MSLTLLGRIECYNSLLSKSRSSCRRRKKRKLIQNNISFIQI